MTKLFFHLFGRARGVGAGYASRGLCFVCRAGDSDLDPEPMEPGDAEAIAEGRADAARGDVLTTDELLAYLARCNADLEPDDDTDQ